MACREVEWRGVASRWRLPLAELRDPALVKLAALVHYLDVDGDPVPEAAGVETIMAGLRADQSDDDQILAVMTPVLDGLYAGFVR